MSLKMLPKTDAIKSDAILLILYGHRALLSQPMVSADTIMAGLNVSGASVDRVDKALRRNVEHINVIGSRRGKKYGLTNPGVRHTEGLARTMLA